VLYGTSRKKVRHSELVSGFIEGGIGHGTVYSLKPGPRGLRQVVSADKPFPGASRGGGNKT